MQKMEIFRRVMVKLTGNSEDQLKENRHHYTQHYTQHGTKNGLLPENI